MMLKYEVMTDSHFESLYKYRETWVPCYFKDEFFPFLQSTQRIEGFNAVIKRYVNPHKSILNFVKQYQKIQTHILVREDSKDYRTGHLETEMWPSYPIKKQAYDSYTRDLYGKFCDEFQLTGRCDCCKIERDGMLCCHILKVFNQLGVDEIPAQYIIRRWTPLAISDAPPAVEDKPDELPPQLKIELRHANLVMDFGSLARVASASDAVTDIVKKHMRGACHEIRNLNMSRKKKPTVPPAGPTSGPPASAGGSTPPPSNTRATRGPALDADGPKEGPSVCRQQKRTSAAWRKKAAVQVASRFFIVQEESGSEVSTTIGKPPARHAHPPLNIAILHAAVAAAQGASMVEPHFGKTTTTPNPTIPREPPKSTTKGREKLRRIESALELHPKRKNKCSYCGSVNHNGAQRKTRLV
ncbi:hypothetical protein D1007_08767 [Hordeum vulgare]|nr:hypothetical protein D1007_08767 [Hordeum vulgare]